jgi:hypothetical protein
MQSVPITTDVVSSNFDRGEVYNIMCCLSVSSTNKTDRGHYNIVLTECKRIAVINQSINYGVVAGGRMYVIT